MVHPRKTGQHTSYFVLVHSYLHRGMMAKKSLIAKANRPPSTRCGTIIAARFAGVPAPICGSSAPAVSASANWR